MFREVQSATLSSQVGDVLKEWRTRAVTIILYVLVAAAVPAYAITIADVLRTGSWLTLGVTTGVIIVLIVAAVKKGSDYRLRGWIIVAVAYIIAIVQFHNNGLEGIGRIYLLATPLCALVLIGNRAGLIATALSLIVYGAFFLFAYTGTLERWLLPPAERLNPSIWFTSGFMLIVLLIMNFILLMRMSRFLVNVLRQERRSLAELEQTYDETLQGWAHALELRGIEGTGHCHRLWEITKRLVGEAELINGGIDDLYRGALLHDIGKMGIPDSVLLKPGRLTGEEFKQMQEHTTYAYDLLANIPYLRKALDIPYCHHEKWDGTGYPRGLKGTEIPLAARIFSVVDVYDELVSDRPSHGAWSEEQALAHIMERAGTEFDPAVVEAFIRLAEAEAGSLGDMEENISGELNSPVKEDNGR